MSRPGQSYTPLPASWSVSAIVAEICDRAGVPFDALDVSLIEGYCDGFSTTNAHSAASAIEALAGVYLFDPANFGGMLQFVPRGGEPVASIDLDDMVDDGNEIEQLSRQDSIAVPRVVNLEYYDTEGGLTTDKQTSDRSIDNRSRGESTTETVIIMRANDAARSVVIGHKVSIEEQRGEITFSLPDSWLELTVSDVVTVRGERMRITQVDLDEGQQRYTAVYDRQSAYSSVIQGVPIDQPSVPPPLVVSESRIEIIDSPILRDADDALGYYVAVSSTGMNWTGAVVELSLDGGATWSDSDDVTLNADMGSLAAPLAAHSPHYRDDHNTIIVEMLRDDMELLPASMTEMMNRANLAIVGNELLNFSEAEQIGETTWELRGLLRGRKGTAAASHLAGERFVLMNRADLAFIPAELFDLGRQLTFRVTSHGATSGQTKTITFTGQSQRERQPAYLEASRDGSDLHVSWQGVGRLGGGATVSMGANFTGYRVSLGGQLWDTTARTITIPYAAGELSVQQINSITGLGPAITVSV